MKNRTSTTKKGLLSCILGTLLICSAFIQQLETSKTDNHLPIVAAIKMNVLYIGFENPLQIAISGVEEKNTKVEVSKGVIEKVSTGHYSVKIKEAGEVMINLTGETESGDTLRYAIPFRAKRIPDPIAIVGRQWKSGITMKSGEFKVQQGLRAILLDFPMDVKYQVNSYQVTMIKSEKPIKTVINKGARYEEQAQTLISQADSGDIFLYEKIKVTGPDSVSLDLEPVFYRIK